MLAFNSRLPQAWLALCDSQQVGTGMLVLPGERDSIAVLAVSLGRVNGPPPAPSGFVIMLADVTVLAISILLQMCGALLT